MRESVGHELLAPPAIAYYFGKPSAVEDRNREAPHSGFAFFDLLSIALIAGSA